MSLWVDKYRPTSLDKLDLHKPLSVQLKKLCAANDFPHLLVYGPSGAGKKTRITCLLRELFGSGAEKMKIEHSTLQTPSKKTIELVTVASNYHIELNPSDSGTSDRFVVSQTIKDIAQSHQVDAAAQRSFKVVVLHEVDRLSKGAQHALRRTMEKYTSSCRLILCCNSTSKVIDPIRSRCLAVRVPAPTVQEISGVVANVCKRESLVIPPELATRIAEQSERNLRKALLMLEATKVSQYPFTAQQTIQRSDWEEYLIQLAKEIAEEQSPRRLLQVRGKMYELLSHCIPPEIIIKHLALELLKKLDADLKYEVMRWAAFYEHRLQQGTKPIFHLEAFVAKFMFIYKRFLVNMEDQYAAMMQ